MERTSEAARAWVTTPDRSRLLAPLPSAPTGAAADATVEIDEARPDQPMDGFGAALTDSSAFVIDRLPAARQGALLRDLFDPRDGIGLSVVRVCMGASDFSSRGSYTYHDLPPGEADPDLSRFSVEHDRRYILPLLRRIRKINPRVKVLATPWTAPAWMKTSKKLHGGWLDWPAYPAYARYFVKFLQAYRAEGVPVWAVTPQNEPRHETDSYPSMRMEPRDQARFVRDHLGPALAAAKLDTRIFAWDHNWDAPDFPAEVLADAGARRYIAGVAWHAYGGKPEAQEKVRKAFPDVPHHFTEMSGGQWATDFGGNLRWDMQNLFVGSVRHGSRSVLKWNLALDEGHGPRNGGCPNCRGVVTIDSRTGAVTRTEDYYVLAHSAKWVKPGARRVESSGAANDLLHVAYRNPDGSLAALLCDLRNAGPRRVALRAGKRPAATIELPAGSVATTVWAPT